MAELLATVQEEQLDEEGALDDLAALLVLSARVWGRESIEGRVRLERDRAVRGKRNGGDGTDAACERMP